MARLQQPVSSNKVAAVPPYSGRLIIVIPLLISLLFAFSYLPFQAHRQQVHLATVKSTHRTVAPLPTTLPLITHPYVPTLTAIPTHPDAAVPTTDDSASNQGVGPSPTNASDTLQRRGDAKSDDGNTKLQATRNALKLDELSL